MTSYAVLFFITLLLIAVLLEPLAQKLKISFCVVLVVLGFIGSEFTINELGVDTGIRWHNFHFIIINILLPVLIFQAAARLDIRMLRKSAATVFLLSVPFMLLAATLTGALLYYGIGHPSGFPWLIALLTGVLLSATDPSAVISPLKKAQALEKLAVILEGESLFSDAVAIVMFTLIISILLAGEQGSWQTGIIKFLLVFSGGTAVGIGVGIAGYLILRYQDSAEAHALITLLIAYVAYIIAGEILMVSGVMAVLTAGLIIGEFSSEFSGKCNESSQNLLGFSAYFSNLLIFIMAGITVRLSMFSDQWLAMLIGIIAVLLTRSIIMFALLPLCSLVLKIDRIPCSHQVILTWGGIRGTVTMALALSLPQAVESWYTVQSVAYGVVLFTLFVQTTSMEFAVRKLKI